MRKIEEDYARAKERCEKLEAKNRELLEEKRKLKDKYRKLKNRIRELEENQSSRCSSCCC